jgi:hypothetical protein
MPPQLVHFVLLLNVFFSSIQFSGGRSLPANLKLCGLKIGAQRHAAEIKKPTPESKWAGV